MKNDIAILRGLAREYAAAAAAPRNDERRALHRACNDLRMVGADLYFKRSNGEVVKVLPR